MKFTVFLPIVIILIDLRKKTRTALIRRQVEGQQLARWMDPWTVVG